MRSTQQTPSSTTAPARPDSRTDSRPCPDNRTEQAHTATRRASSPNLTHVTPQPFLDPIQHVNRETISWKRKVFHILGIGCAGLTYALAPISRLEAVAILGAITVIFAGLDVLRFFVPALNKKVKRDFGPFMRNYELNGLSSSSWFLFSAVLSIALFPKLAASLAILYLALGDPLASWAGVKWGRHRLPGGKSVEGSLTLFLACTVVGTVFFATLAGAPLAVALGVGAASALAASFAEWLPIKSVDDNFILPLVGAAAITPLLGLL